MDLHSQELRKHGIRLRLPAQAFRVLVMLLERRGELVTREELRQSLWPDQPWGELDSRLNKTVRTIREALSDSADAPRFVETVPKAGYRFLVPVETIAQPSEPESAPPQPSSAPQLEPLPRPASPRGLPWVAVAVGLLIAALAYGWWRLTTGSADALTSFREERLTSFIGLQRQPAFSPDGKQVVFSWDGEQRENFDVYLIRPGELNPRRLTTDPQPDSEPAFSPDGSRFAFLRETAPFRGAIVIFDLRSGNETPVAQFTWSRFTPPSLDWTPQEEWLVSTDLSSDGQSACYLISALNGARRRLTSPPVNSRGDFAPAISPNGRMLAFARSTSRQWKEIFVVDLNADLSPAGEPRQLTHANEQVHAIAWSRNSERLIYTAGPWGGGHYLRSAAIDGSSPPRSLAGVETQGRDAAVSPVDDSIAFVRMTSQNGLWSFTRPDGTLTRLLAANTSVSDADWSAEGTRMAFVMSGAGHLALWTARGDGREAKKLVSFPNSSATKPRWSPDGRWIAFDTRASGQSEVYVANSETGDLRNATDHPGDDFLPSWSADGATLYFCSTRGGNPQIWRMPASGGPASAVTNAGVAAMESPDGKWIYFTQSYPPARLSRIPGGGGPVEEIAQDVQTMPGFAPDTNGVYYLTTHGGKTRHELRYWDGRTRRDVLVRSFDVAGFRDGLSVTRDGARVLLSLAEREDGNIHVLRPAR